MLFRCGLSERIFILLSPDSVRRQILDVPRTFHCKDYFVVGGIRTCLGVSSDPMFLWISSNSCPLNLLLVRSQIAEITIVKCLIQGRNNAIRMLIDSRSFDQDRRKNDAFTLSVTLSFTLPTSFFPLPTKMYCLLCRKPT